MRCELCDTPIPAAEGSGRIRRFCSNACRQKAYRARSRRDIPSALTERDRWVLWESRPRGGKVTKVPVTVHGREARVDDARTWTTYAKASECATDGRIGFVLGEGIGCIDLDDCVSGGKVAAWAQAFIDKHRDEAILIELSPSGEGVHIFLPLEEGPGRRIRRGEMHVEVYSRARYMTVTGKRV